MCKRFQEHLGESAKIVANEQVIFKYVLIWNRGVPLYTEMTSLQGVGIEEFHCICPHFRVLE